MKLQYIPEPGWSVQMIRVHRGTAQRKLIDWIVEKEYVLLNVQQYLYGDQYSEEGVFVQFAAPKTETFDELRPHILPPR